MDRKKELREQYRLMKPNMGIFIIRAVFTNKCYLESARDLKGKMNGTLFKLGSGNHPNRELQKDWQEYGENSFTIEILETLDYDKDESKTDYTEELDLLQMIWEEKLAKEHNEFYQNKPSRGKREIDCFR